MVVLLSEGFKQHTATQGQTQFNVPFEFEKNEYVKAFKNTVTLALGVDYTLTGAGSDSGGTLTLTSGATAGDIITVRLDVPIERNVDFPQAGNFKSSSLNSDLDRIVLILKQLFDLMDRKVGFKDTDVVTDFDLPTPEAGKFWKVSADALTFDQVDIVDQGQLDIPVAVSNGGTGATTVAGAKSNLGFLDSGDIGVSVQAHDADTLKADTTDELTAGFTAAIHDAGTKSTGTFTPAFADGNFQKYVNGGAHTLAPPSTGNGTMILQVTNNASAGAVTTSGFTKVTGDTITTTDGDDFLFVITKLDGFTHLLVLELQ